MRFPIQASRLFGFILGIFVFCLPLFSQTTTGRILGTVTDQSGAALPSATVTILDVQRGSTRTLSTDEAGVYLAPDLIPGTYKIRAEAKGFKSVERLNLELEVAKDLRIDFALPPGQVSETIVVNEEAPLLDTTSSTLGGTLSNRQINDLPVNGRNYENLLQLRPGVTRYPGGGFSTTSTNGLRAEDNGYIIDGLFNSEPYSGQGIINGAGIAGDSATILPIDSIQEFNLQENPSAEYGWKPGAVVNVGLKSGTNGLHGTAFIFGRDGAMDARNYFNCANNPCAVGQSPSPKNPRTLEQFGGSVGGPIIKDKAFFFGAYEGQRYDVGNQFGGVTSPSMVSMPDAGNCLVLTTGDCANSIPDTIADVHAAFLAGVIPNDVSPASLKVSGCTFSAAGAVACDGTGFPTNDAPSINIVNGFPNVVNVNNVMGKGDVHLNEHISISGMYFFGNNSGTVEDFPELQSKWRSHIHTRAQVFGTSWVWVPNARWVNEARFGYNRLYQPTLPGDLNTPASSYGLDTGVAAGPLTGGLPRIGFGGYFFPGLGGFKWPKFQGPDTIVQFIDHVSYTAGKHALKFGGEFHRNGVTGGAFGNARGSINFLDGTFTGPTGVASSQLEDFFAGAPTLASVLSGDPTRHLHNWAYAAFLQDDWRLSRNLTVNFGLRYEFNSVVKEAHNLLGNFDPNLGLVQVGKQISAPYNADHKNFAPRFGFAWDVSGRGNTVVRGGGSLIYETVNWQSFLAFNNSFGLPSVPTGAVIDAAGDTAGGTITTGNLSPSPANPWDNGPIFGDLTKTITCDPVDANPCGIMGVDRKLTTPYVWNWTLNVQHAFTPNLSVEVGYVGNHGTNLTGIRDINQPPVGSGWPAALVTACATSGYDPSVCAPADEQGPRPFNAKFPYLSNIFQMGNVYRSNYNGLQATLTARNYHGLSAVAGYTFSHALDDVGANWHFGYGVGLPQDSYNLGREYAGSDFDVRHRLTLSLTYAIPGKKGFGQALEGWEINSIVTLQTPQYWGPIDLGTDASGTGPLPVSPPATSPIRWSFFGKPSDFKSGPAPIPFFAGASNSACAAQALSLDGGDPLGPSTTALNLFGCYAKGSSMMIPPPLGHFGNMGRNTFPDSCFRNFDFSLAKNWHFGERFRAQFRAEFFNIFNHPNFANPYGGQNGYGQNDPSTGFFGCGCATPDVAAANPVVGSGGSRAVQLGLKLIF
jgi:Carboxypeptidase regulatory-like domain/TonB dependent receptor